MHVQAACILYSRLIRRHRFQSWEKEASLSEELVTSTPDRNRLNWQIARCSVDNAHHSVAIHPMVWHPTNQETPSFVHSYMHAEYKYFQDRCLSHLIRAYCSARHDICTVT